MQELQVYIRNKWMKKERAGESGGEGGVGKDAVLVQFFLEITFWVLFDLFTSHHLIRKCVRRGLAAVCWDFNLRPIL